MRAMVIHDFGGPEVLSYEEIATPEPAPGEVLVRVHAVSVNQTLDIKLRQGTSRRGAKLPHILGVDPSGVVAALGQGVTAVHEGDRVVVASSMWCGACEACLCNEPEDCAKTGHIGVARHGGYAEYVAVPEANVHRIGDDLDFPDASVIIRHFPTSFNLLHAKAGLVEGETVLVMGASGGLGGAGIQVAKLAGATVIAGAGTADRVAAAMELGADHGVAYRKTDLAEAVAKITDGRGVDVVYENVSDPAMWDGVMASLARRGRLVTAGAHGGGHVELNLHQLYRSRQRLIGGGGHSPADMARTLEAANAGRLQTNIDRLMPLSQAVEAHRLAEARAITGKIVLLPQEDPQ